MMPQKEIGEALQQHADPDYGRYEGKQTSSARQYNETPYEQELREEPSGKVYPFPRDHTNVFQFVLVVIALGLLVLFGILFVVVVGGTTGWVSFAAACFVLCCVLAYSWSMRPPGK